MSNKTKALLLCAGLGTRLGKLTDSLPKPMLPIAGRPLLAHLVEWLSEAGITEIAMNLHHQPDVIPRYFGDGDDFDVSIVYSYEKELLGTAGAAKHLEQFLDEPFVVAYGDVLTNIDLLRLIERHRAPVGRESDREKKFPLVTMALYRVPDPTQCGIVALDSDHCVTQFVEKPDTDALGNLAFSGVMVCNPKILKWIPAEQPFDFGHDLLPALLQSGEPVQGFEINNDEYVVDIGTLPGYEKALSMKENLSTTGLSLDRSEKNPAVEREANL